MPASPARIAAFEILLRVERQNAYASELLHSQPLASLTPADHGLCTELVMGTLRWQSALDRDIEAFSSQTLQRLDAEVLIALRLGAYQLRFLERVPARAAVNETVELVKRARKKSAAPFVNGVLRNLARNPQPEGLADSPAAIAATYAHPIWLVERWTREYGVDAVRRICQAGQQPPPHALRFLTADVAAVERELQAEGIALAPGLLTRSARIVLSGDVVRTRAFHDRRIAIQDEGSQLVAALVGRGSRILDCCAAPGSKTAVLATSNPQASIVAVELHPHRADLLRRRVNRSNVEVITADATALARGRDFDRVLADVPCSGTGTLARNPEIKWKLRADDLADLHRRQAAILSAALGHLAPGGVLVYSTCSLEPEENRLVVEEVLSGDGGFKLLDCRARLQELKIEGEFIWPEPESLCRGPFLQTLPGVDPCDGFFAAMIAR